MRARRVDKNQPAVVERLREIGCKVYLIEEPVDLLVGYRGKTVLLEVKTPDGLLTKQQAEFVQTWPGGAHHIVRDPEEAVNLVIQECK